MLENVNWLGIILALLYGFAVTYFGGIYFFRSVSKAIQKGKIKPMFLFFFLVVAVILLSLPGFFHLSYWLTSLVTSLVTTLVMILIFKKHTKTNGKGS